MKLGRNLSSVGNVIQFPNRVAHTTPLGQFIRLGDDGGRALSDLFAAGKFLPERIVVDASRFDQQRELVQALRDAGVEIVLDPKTAELAVPGKFKGGCKNAPWASVADGRPLGQRYFGKGSIADVIGQLARFAVRNRVDTVLAPTHWLGDLTCRDWLDRDIHSVLALRTALDREGGTGIAIDYPLILPHTMIQDYTERERLIYNLRSLPFDNLWIRASGFKNIAAPLTTRRQIEALIGLNGFGRPIVADYIGGLTGNILMAFGAVSAISCGIGKLEGFDARSWHKNQVVRNFGREDGLPRSQKRLLIGSIGRSLTGTEAQWLATARNGRRLIACNDRECCVGGLADTLKNPRRHAAWQANKQFRDLARIPDLKRADYMIDDRLEKLARNASMVAKLKPETTGFECSPGKFESLVKRIGVHADTLDKTRSALEDFRRNFGNELTRSKPVCGRQAQRDLFGRNWQP